MSGVNSQFMYWLGWWVTILDFPLERQDRWDDKVDWEFDLQRSVIVLFD